MRPVDYVKARAHLDALFAQAEQAVLGRQPVVAPQEVHTATDTVFASPTQSYREALLGCVLAKSLDAEINIRQPYAAQGRNAFNGRTLDEKVVNPFLREKRVPCSTGPYLNVFRRSVAFVEATRKGLRDKRGYDAFLALIAHAESLPSGEQVGRLLLYLLFRFAEMREEATVPLAKVQRISLEQYETVLRGLLAVPSGGRFPLWLVVATFNAIQKTYELPWEVAWQGINVADAASGAAGDITIRSKAKVLLSAEVTERQVNRTRVSATFETKISVASLEDYLFFTASGAVTDEARQLARQYFAQGHEVNFLCITEWILMVLATLGPRGRSVFSQELYSLLEDQATPRALKVAWNGVVNSLLRQS